uniref:Ankyrin repeat-containing protein n=1 Tax=Tanacetum cinerariifolium TaxID=118510 RepID=A0A6L2JIG7_TANCI|nr:ankyrin repeat-containing protein [Tanacetum cinerariifolium]
MMTEVTDLEAKLERFKIDQVAINSEAAEQRALLQETIEKNKFEADRQFAEIMNAIKALQPPTTLPATIPRFEEKSGESYTSSKVDIQDTPDCCNLKPHMDLTRLIAVI